MTAPRVARLTTGGVVSGLIRSFRIRQWAKNGVIFAAVLFSHRMGNPGSLERAFAAFGIFCLLSSAVYLLNDVFDLRNDRVHPTKRFRPIAAGEVPPPLALVVACALGILALGLAYAMVPAFALVGAVYLGSNVLYSVWLKRIVIVDVMVISMGFVLRAVAGGLAIGVTVSAWLILCTILLSLFLALCKRRQELVLLEGATEHRGILKEYSVAFLDQMITIVTSATLLAYASYTLSPEVQQRLGTDRLYLTVPFVIYGVFRYLYLVHKRDLGGSPTEALFGDRPLLINILLWSVAAGLILYMH
ncbi:MAG: decaprenyl-phosphate phosphoribosyltransferase [Acidobacteria bacterium]|nr:decaprenyl-phosphate phosphoribosyltransferase [Acidobacteriota bacterium]